METITLDHPQYMESISHIADDATRRFARQAETWWNRHFSWKKDGCRVLTDDTGKHLAYLFYKVDRYRDYLTIHNLFTPQTHRDNGYAFSMLASLFCSQADNGVRRFRMSCTPQALGFYTRLSLVYWGVDTIGNFHCDLPLPKEGIAGIDAMIKRSSDTHLLGEHARSIYAKVKENGSRFDETALRHFESDKKMLGCAYRHDRLRYLIS